LQSKQSDSPFVIQSTLNPVTNTQAIIQVIKSSLSTHYRLQHMSLSSSKFTFSHALMYKEFSIRLCVSLVSRPQTEKSLSTKACDAGAEITSCATSGTGWDSSTLGVGNKLLLPVLGSRTMNWKLQLCHVLAQVASGIDCTARSAASLSWCLSVRQLCCQMRKLPDKNWTATSTSAFRT